MTANGQAEGSAPAGSDAVATVASGPAIEGKLIHRCLHVLDLDASLEFYRRALGMEEIRRMGPDDGSWCNVFLGNDTCGFQLELTWNRGRVEPYDNGGGDSHLAVTVPDLDAARARHEEMGCICHVNDAMGLYFIEDPDGCWIEVLPMKQHFAPQPGVDVLDALRRRHSVRSYAAEPVPRALLDAVVDAGLLAASGRRIRPWELYVVTDRAQLDALAACRDHGSAMLAGATAAVVVAARPDASDTWVEDCSIVMANMLLEASASGVAGCWIQARMRQAQDGRSTQEFISELLGLPQDLAVEAVLSLGMPEDPQAFAATRRDVTDELRGKAHWLTD